MPSLGEITGAGGAQAALMGAPQMGMPPTPRPKPQLGFFDRIAQDPMRMMMFTDILRGAGGPNVAHDQGIGVGGYKGFSQQGAGAFQDLIGRHGPPTGGFPGLVNWLGTAGAPPVSATGMTPPPVGRTNYPAPGVAGAGSQPLSAVAALNSSVAPQASPLARLGVQADEALARLGNLGGGLG